MFWAPRSATIWRVGICKSDDVAFLSSRPQTPDVETAGHVVETAGHVVETAGHVAETALTGHFRVMVAFCALVAGGACFIGSPQGPDPRSRHFVLGGEHRKDRSTLLDLIGVIYDAVLEPELWTGTLKKAASFVGGSGASIFSQDAIRKEGNAHYQFGVDAHYEQLSSISTSNSTH